MTHKNVLVILMNGKSSGRVANLLNDEKVDEAYSYENRGMSQNSTFLGKWSFPTAYEIFNIMIIIRITQKELVHHFLSSSRMIM